MRQKMNKPIHVGQLRAMLSGPIASIRTAFNRDGSIDFDGVRRMMDFHIKAGCKVSLLTAGDSHFACMTDDEIAEINRVVVEHGAGRTLTVACDWEFATPQATKFAQYCADLGADILMARPADWAHSATVESLVAHYSSLAEIMPVMLVTNIFQGRPEKFGLEVISALLERAPNLLAMKEDLSGDFARKACLLAHSRWAIFSGGGLRNHLNTHPYGCDGLMDRHMNFAPQTSYRYWEAIQRNDLAAAREVIRTVEIPLENFMGAFPGGRDAAMHGLLEVVGIAGRWRRKPYHSLSDTEMKRLGKFVKKMELCTF